MALWEYSGLVRIERLGDDERPVMELPVCFQSPGEAPPLTPEEIERRAREAAENFLSMLRDTVPGHAADYGQILGVDMGVGNYIP